MQFVTACVAFLFKCRFCNSQVYREHGLNVSVQNKQKLDSCVKPAKTNLYKDYIIFTHILYVFKTNSQLNKVQSFLSLL